MWPVGARKLIPFSGPQQSPSAEGWLPRNKAVTTYSTTCVGNIVDICAVFLFAVTKYLMGGNLKDRGFIVGRNSVHGDEVRVKKCRVACNIVFIECFKSHRKGALTVSFSPLYSNWNSLPWDGAAHIQCGSSLLK